MSDRSIQKLIKIWLEAADRSTAVLSDRRVQIERKATRLAAQLQK
jgi:hypothetical protein